MGCRVNGNRVVPYFNSSRRWPVKRRHGGYKLFVSCSILFDKLEIGTIPGEYMFLSNWRIQIVLLGKHGCSTRIRGFGYSIIERFHGINSNYYMWFTFTPISIFHAVGQCRMVEYSWCSCSCSTASFTGFLGYLFLNFLGDIFNSHNHIWWNSDWWGCVPGLVTGFLFPDPEVVSDVGNGS